MYLLLLAGLLHNTVLLCFAEPGDVSEQKCKSYGEAVYVEQPDLGMSSATGVHKVSECGIVAVPLIIGGEKATPKEFPHFALIGFGQSAEDELEWLCGGSLISDRYVLTAAHCSTSQQFGDAQRVKLGMTNLESDSLDAEDSVKEEFIEKIINHPDHKAQSKYNDICLLHLKNDVEFSPYIRPACLNRKHVISEHSAIAAGFGKTTYEGKEGSKALMKVTLDLISRDECQTFYPKARIMEEGVVMAMMCAGILTGGKDTCQGDSGGPLQVILEEPYCMYNIIGVTSFGAFCGFANSPAIYSNVSHYLPWIESTVWP